MSVWTGRPPAVQRRVNEDNKFYMLQCVLRIPELFSQAKEEIKPEYFDRMVEPHYAILWRAVLNVAEANEGILPPSDIKAQTLIELEATKLAAGAPANVAEGGAVEQLFVGTDGSPGSGIIGDIYSSRESEALDYKAALELMKAFLKERIVIDPVRDILDKLGDNNVPGDIDKILDQARANSERIASMDASPVEEVFVQDWESSAIVQVPTNVSFLDMAMDGGPAKGEVIVLLGPTGGGKTLAAIMVAVNGARYQMQLANKGEDSGYWYYFSYESPITPDIRTRVISYAAEISYPETMKTFRSVEQLSTSINLKDYEKKRWEKQIKSGLVVPGERERLDAAIAAMGDRLKLIDMSGTKNPAIGTRYMDEIVRTLNDGVSKGQKPVGIVIDYAGIMVERYMAARNEKVENEFHYLNRFVNNVRVQIASRFNCIPLVLHQLHGEAGAASPTAKQHHSKARGARNFADNANFAFNIGVKDTTNNCCMITCSKARRADMMKEPPIVRIDGAFGMMVAEDQKYMLDANTRKIVDKQIGSMYKGNVKEISQRLISRTPKSNVDPSKVSDI